MAKFTRVLDRRRPVTIIRGLRFRLAAGFLIFFTLFLLLLGVLVRQMLDRTVHAQNLALLKEYWDTSQGFLRVEHQQPVWYYDRFDPEESLIVNRILGNVYLFADKQGNILGHSELASSLGLDSSTRIRELIERLSKQPDAITEVLSDAKGTPYLVRSGLTPDKDKNLYLLVIGRSDAAGTATVDNFTWKYFALVPPIVLLCGTLGWLLAGRAIAPVNEVARAAQKISGSNLNVQIATRGANDELDHLIEAFNRMIERLNYSFEQIRQFSTDVSHELRTPLTAIRGQLEVALFTAEKPDQFRDAMVNALQDVEQLTNIVRALLLLSQAESGQIVLQMSRVNVSAVVRDIVDQFQIPAEEAQVTLEAEAAGDVAVPGDRTQLERLVSNLLSNSIKYTPPRGRIVAGVRHAGERVQIWVEDNGIGIPAEKLPHIFDRFYRVRPSQSNPVQGLGLGLSFVSWIVNAHGGKIEVDSIEGKGTRFTVWLPPAAPAEAEIVTERPGVTV